MLMLRYTTLRICVFTLLAFSANLLPAQNFQVQIAAFSDSISTDYFKDRGLQAVYKTIDQNGLHRYYAGAYENRELAETVVEQLKDQGFLYATIIDLEEQRVLCGVPCNFNTGGQQYTEDPSQRLTVREIYFDSGSDFLSKESIAELDYISRVLKDNPGTELRIMGHTDAVGDVKRNIELAKERCRSARNYLINKSVHASRLYTKVFGELNPENDRTPPDDEENEDDTLGKDSKTMSKTQGKRTDRKVVLVVVAPNGEVQSNEKTKVSSGRK